MELCCCFPLFKILGIFGLALDAIGVVGLFFYGFPNIPYMKNKTWTVVSSIPKEEESEYRKIKLLSNLSIIFIVMGFILQAIGIFSQ